MEYFEMYSKIFNEFKYFCLHMPIHPNRKKNIDLQYNFKVSIYLHQRFTFVTHSVVSMKEEKKLQINVWNKNNSMRIAGIEIGLIEKWWMKKKKCVGIRKMQTHCIFFRRNCLKDAARKHFKSTLIWTKKFALLWRIISTHT